MDQELALAILLSGRSALLTGAAGTGKTYLLNTFIAQARKRGKKVSVTATTGLAATHLGGNTIHSWSGIGVSDHLPNNFFERLSKTRRDVISKTDVLIIDEISMLHDFRLDMIDKVLRTVRENDQPFGGIQLVMSGEMSRAADLWFILMLGKNFSRRFYIWSDNIVRMMSSFWRF